ncbi:hypothetical protein [Algibacter sp. 2305UL17-15]|uniref:hypothetical protein n=1 Tax=Algibacter sp. 2305UL17-15 TaxID=3231268 RepID=UPI003457ED66
MKNIIYVLVILIYGTAMAQEKPAQEKPAHEKPKEINTEITVKRIQYEDGDEIKVNVVTRETSDVKFDKNDTLKVNQERLPITQNVEKTVTFSGDSSDTSDELVSKGTHYISEDKNYKFTPSDKGFDIYLETEKNEFVIFSKVWSSNNKDSYVVKGENYNGVGYFNEKEEFVVEYYDEDSGSIKTKTYKKKKDNP